VPTENPFEFLLHLRDLDEGMMRPRQEIHDNIDVTVRAEMIGRDRAEDLEFPDVPHLAELLDLVLPAPDEGVHSSLINVQ